MLPHLWHQLFQKTAALFGRTARAPGAAQQACPFGPAEELRVVFVRQCAQAVETARAGGGDQTGEHVFLGLAEQRIGEGGGERPVQVPGLVEAVWRDRG